MRSLFVLLLALMPALPITLFAQGKKLSKIVLDAGHGGKDAGARGVTSLEKNLTLAITIKLGKIIADSMKGTQVIFTRTTDVYPTLVERHEVANKAAADLFISIHINSTAARTERIQTGTRRVKRGKRYVQVPVYRTISHRETATRGTETIVLGNIRNKQRSDALEEYIPDEEGLLNPADPQTQIILAQYMATYLDASVKLGSRISENFEASGRPDRGVHQQSLEVLAGSYMPGVLVECGFINNAEDEEYMNSEKGQMEIAMSIFRGIRSYKADLERAR